MRTIAGRTTAGTLSVLAFACCCLSASSREMKTWMITQFHEINGKEVTYIAKDFVRLDRLTNGYSIIIDERAGRVYFFSDKEKLLYKTKIKGFNYQSVNLLRMFTGDSRAGDSWRRAGSTRIGNTEVIRFISEDYSNVFRGAKEGGYLSGEKRVVETETSFYVSKEIAISKDVSKLLSQLQGTKDLGYVPLKEVTAWKEKIKTKTNLDLLDVRRIDLDVSKRLIPKGYRETSDLRDITNKDKSPAEELLCK